jgi:cell volume regulation protein A
MQIIYLIAPLLLLGIVLAAVWLDRWSVPVILVALGLGIVSGSDVLGLWYFDDVHLSNEIANASLVFILFYGGLATKRSEVRAVALPAGGLATWGVLLTAAGCFLVLHFALSWPYELALMLAVVISSTDAAATFSILRRQSLPAKLSSTLQIESAANDPMAILLTLVVVERLTSGGDEEWLVALLFVWKFLAGPVVGWLMARGALAVFDRLNPQDRGYYYVLLLAIVLLTYGIAELAHASGMLAVFTAGLVMGNRRFIYQQGVRNFSAALSMIANIGVFVMMGLLVFPRQWAAIWVDGLILFAVLTFVARPAAIWLGTLGMKIGMRERHFMCWAGLRGAVPIVLATYPMAAGIPQGQEVFNLVFFAVLLSVTIQGSTLGWLAQVLRLSTPSRPQPRYGLELVTMAHSELDLFVIDLPDPPGRPGPRIRDLDLPPKALITLVTRGQEVVAPMGTTRLLGWDQVTVLARAEDEDEVRSALLEPFDRPLEPEEPAARILPVKHADLLPATGDRPLQDHIVLLGHGRVGAVLAEFLKHQELPFLVIEQDATIVEQLARQGQRVLPGRGDDPEVLTSAGVARAKLLLITSAEFVAVRRTIAAARRLNQELEIIVRVHQEAHRALLAGDPRTQCVQAEVALAYAMARRMLLAAGVSAIEVEAILMDARRGGSAAAPSRTRVVEIHVPASSALVGRTIADLALPSGTLVITIARAGEFVVPSGQAEIRANDALLVLADLETARALERRVLEARPPAS